MHHIGKEPQPALFGHSFRMGEFVVRNAIQRSHLTSQRGERGLPQNRPHRPGLLATAPAGIDLGSRLVIDGEYLPPIAGCDLAAEFGRHITGVKLKSQLAIGIEHRQTDAILSHRLIPAELPVTADTVICRGPTDHRHRGTEFCLDSGQQPLLLAGTGMKQDQLGQLARSTTVAHGSAQQLPHIHPVTAGTGHPECPFLIVQSSNGQPISVSGMVSHLGHDTTARAAPKQAGRRELAFERVAQYRPVMGLGKIE